MARSATMEIAEADEERISADLLEWSGLQALWDQHQLEGLLDFARDVAFRCRHISKKSRHWSNLPGHGGVTYTVVTKDEHALRAEMRFRIELLLRERSDEIAAHQDAVRARARARAERVAKGPECTLTVADDHVSLVARQFEPDQVHALGVSTEDWRDIQAGEPIEYPKVIGLYEGLKHHETWRFNVPEGGTVWIGDERTTNFQCMLADFRPRGGS